MRLNIKLFFIIIFIPFSSHTSLWARDLPLEKSVLQQLLNYTAVLTERSGKCDIPDKYTVYLIDNFDQTIPVVPGLQISHGELMYAMLVSGRNDIEVKTLNTTLNNGLAVVLAELLEGGCVDGVISSIPGSNYSYRQVSSFLPVHIDLNPENILDYRADLREMMISIAVQGFPSVEWLMRSDVNPIKLREDARKIFFIEKLGELGVPVLLPYGNIDGYHRGEERNINLLSLSEFAMIFSAKGYGGKPMPGFPSSPLSSGYEIAQYQVIECPDYDDALRVNVDVNNDGFSDFSYNRGGAIPYYDEDGSLSRSPPLATSEEFLEILREAADGGSLAFSQEIVFSLEQYQQFIYTCPECAASFSPLELKDFVWFNSSKHGRTISFYSQCEQKNEISGTSLIPPMKIKELLPQKVQNEPG